MKLSSLSLPFSGSTQGIRPLSRDKLDTLLLLLACLLVLAPHSVHAPLWVSMTCSALLLWRAWLTFRGDRLPPRWLLVPISLGIMIGVYLTFQSLLGREAGVTMLLLLLGLKLMEMHARRDLFVVIFLSFFLMLASFFQSQSIGTAFLTILAVITMLTAQLSFQFTGVVPPLAARLKLSLMIVGLAIPLTLISFILFPRIQGPLWGMPSDAQTGRIGLSETMTPGNIAKLAASDDVAFRVKFIDPPPPQSKLYWRAVVLGDYNGRTWLPAPTQYHPKPAQFKPRGQPLRHQVTLEPHNKRWLFALELPEAAPVLPSTSAVIRENHHVWAEQPIVERTRYDVTSYLDFTLEANASSNDLQPWLGLPDGYNPATLAFASQLRRNTRNELEYAQALLAFFREQPFRYTLEPPLLGRHAMDEFLFSTRAGFCEHYSSAFVVLMRAAGVPARVVTGYQGGAINPVDGFMTVRQSDAHAWAEIWLGNRGWLRIDPTSAVAPERIERNLSRSLPQTGLASVFSINAETVPWLATLRFNWDAVTNTWNQWVLNYSPDKQKSFLASFGFKDIDWRTMALLLLTVGMAGLAIIALPLMANRQKLDPVQAVYLRFCQLMANKGVPRAPHEGPQHYRLRIMQANANLPLEKKKAAGQFLACYEAAQYGTVSASSKSALVVQLKSLLKQCR